MIQNFNLFRTFISSPGDVREEREIAETVITNMNLRINNSLNSHVQIVKWEHLPPVTSAIPEHRLQEQLDKEVARSDFFVLILNRRYGTVEPGHSKSNTEREINTILRKLQVDPRIRILAYFKEIPDTVSPDEQEQKVRALRNRLSNEGVAYYVYSSTADLKERFTHDLYDVVVRIRLSSFKPEMLRNFWQFGTTGQRTGPRLHIVYPAVPRSADSQAQDNKFWFKRLATSIYFEDYKAIDKITNTLTSIGFHDWHVHSAANLPSDIVNCNRVWICIPRNTPGKEQLIRYGSRACFTFQISELQTQLHWSHSSEGTVTITSPLSTYLQLQRRHLDVHHEWNPEFGHIVAKDFAVLARFILPDQNDTDEEPLRDYFFAGIRGLGTWGAGWYLDRRYKVFQNLNERADLQLLLEVHFKDDRIVEVLDVSSQNQSYFDEEVKESTILSRVNRRALID